MPNHAENQSHVAVARDYFRLLDAGDAAILELFTRDAQVYFPKYGVGTGGAGFLEIATGLGSVLSATTHDSKDYLYIGSGDYLVVEGTTSGTLKDGRQWKATETPTGRFCSVFQFRDNRIARLSIYLDPDYGGDDEARFLWGREGRRW